VTFTVVGELGEVPADVATPLAVVLAELLQNAVEHAFVEVDGDLADRPDRLDAAPGTPATVGHVAVHLASDDSQLTVEVSDDGSGLPAGFDVDVTQSLGLSIVRDLVRTQIEGTITMTNRCNNDPGQSGTVVHIELPVRGPQRTMR
jgi:two-component sensor histidine kinase